MNTKAVLTMVGVIGVPLAAHGAAVTYDFTGTGYFCTLLTTGTPDCTEGIAFTGTVRIDVLAPAPSGPDSFMGDTIAGDHFGWVESDFLIEWDSNSFSPALPPGEPAQRQLHHLQQLFVRSPNRSRLEGIHRPNPTDITHSADSRRDRHQAWQLSQQH